MSASYRPSLRALTAYSLIICFTVLLAVAPEFVSAPIPAGATEIAQADYRLEEKSETITLPHRWSRAMGFGPVHAIYRFDVELPAPDGLNFLLIPAAQQQVTVLLNGERVAGTERQRWGEPAIGSSYALRLPPTGEKTARLEIRLDRSHGGVPGYLSKIYLTNEQGMTGVRWYWSLFGANARIAVIGLQAFLVLGIAVIWFARRSDPMVCWLFMLGLANLAFSVAYSTLPIFKAPGAHPYIAFALPGFGLMAFGLSLAIVGHPRPAALKFAVALIPAALALSSAMNLLSPGAVVTTGALIAIGASFASAAVLARHSCLTRKLDSALLAVPFFLTGWFGLRDIGIVAGLLPHGGLLLSAHVRPITVIAILSLLMRKLAHSLNEIDRVNETLRLKLDEQERQLSKLHDKERGRMTQAAREDERQRLMRDLHDGVSGHLVSIIALSERDSGSPRAIERAARAALDDLRLVVNSLDLDDHDLLPALAGLRERIEPQLRRLDIELKWSMEKLPQVSGVTPSNALSILRILQEAITNAVKHGQPRLIAVHGMADKDGHAVIEVRNQITGQQERGKGNGLKNMALRSQKLGGQLILELDRAEAVLKLLLPERLREL